MKQIDVELQTMTDQFHARHDPEVTRDATTWHLINALLLKTSVSDTSMKAVRAMVSKWRKSDFILKGRSESNFTAARDLDSPCAAKNR